MSHKLQLLVDHWPLILSFSIASLIQIYFLEQKMRSGYLTGRELRKTKLLQAFWCGALGINGAASLLILSKIIF